MNILIITLSALISITAVAQDVPNTFQPGSPIVASEVNENFQSLKNRIDVLEAQLAEQQAEDTPREFVGITTATTTGAAGGRFGMNQLCKNEYPGAKMCRADEVTEANPALITAAAFLHSPADFKVAGGDASSEIHRVFAHGNIEVLNSNEDCSGWTWTGGRHWQLESSSRIANNRNTCNSSQPVACCK
ncbi:hypothetical protein N9Z31_03610 [Pseudomonadales bacterium]|nr:hypothetical protein [Pseudomonadales bacterium]